MAGISTTDRHLWGFCSRDTPNLRLIADPKHLLPVDEF